MRNKVLDFLRDGSGIPEERYNKAMELYRKSEGNSTASVNYYNRAGYTVHNLEHVTYDLRKLHGITDMDLVVVAQPLDDSGQSKNNGPSKELLQQLLAFDPEATKYPDAKKLSKELNLELADQKKATIFEALEKAKAEEVAKIDTTVTEDGTDGTGKENVQIININGVDVAIIDKGDVITAITEAPEAAKAGFKLREEFPFLGEADCPDKLKILVADMFTAWDNYKKAHAELLVITEEGAEPRGMTDAEIFEIANGAIEDFEANRSIWAELDYYKEHKEILGNHPIFADDMLKEAVAKMNSAETLNRRNNLRTYISRESKKIKPDTAPDKADKIRAKIKEYTQELELLDAKLDAKDS